MEPSNETSIDQGEEEKEQHLDEEANTPQLQHYNLARDRQMREIRLPQRFGYANLVSYALSVAKDINSHEPQSYCEAITDKESTQWIAAMSGEIESLHKNHTWKLVERPKNQKIIKSK